MRWRFSVVLLFSVLSLGGVCTGPQKPRREFQLQANSDDFWTLFDRESKLSTVASGFGFTEGPVWDPAGFVIVSDEDRKSTRLNSSHVAISYAVFCLKKKKKI